MNNLGKLVENGDSACDICLDSGCWREIPSSTLLPDISLFQTVATS